MIISSSLLSFCLPKIHTYQLCVEWADFRVGDKEFGDVAFLLVQHKGHEPLLVLLGRVRLLHIRVQVQLYGRQTRLSKQSSHYTQSDLVAFWLVVSWSLVFYVPSTARSYREGTPIYCPLQRTWSSLNTPFQPLCHASSICFLVIVVMINPFKCFFGIKGHAALRLKWPDTIAYSCDLSQEIIIVHVHKDSSTHEPARASCNAKPLP